MEHLPTKLGTRPRLGSGSAPRTGEAWTKAHTNLTVISITPDMHRKTCGYWYLVSSNAVSHTAFATSQGLMNWLDERGLVLEGNLPEMGAHAVLPVSGTYRTTSHLSYDDFFSLEGERIRVLDNGDYTLGVVTTDPDAVRNVHYLNCNMMDRPVFEYQASRNQLN